MSQLDAGGSGGAQWGGGAPPPRAVSWGEATTDEMCIAFIGVTLDGATTNANMTVAQAGFK